MARPVTALVIFFLAFNLFAGMLMATGVDSMIGIDAQVGGDKAVEQVEKDSNEVRTGTSLGNTLFGMYNVLAGGLSDIFTVIFPGLKMLERAGTPTWITGGFLGPLFSFAIAVDFVSFLRGWGL